MLDLSPTSGNSGKPCHYRTTIVTRHPLTTGILYIEALQTAMTYAATLSGVSGQSWGYYDKGNIWLRNRRGRYLQGVVHLL